MRLGSEDLDTVAAVQQQLLILRVEVVVTVTQEPVLEDYTERRVTSAFPFCTPSSQQTRLQFKKEFLLLTEPSRHRHRPYRCPTIMLMTTPTQTGVVRTMKGAIVIMEEWTWTCC